MFFLSLLPSRLCWCLFSDRIDCITMVWCVWKGRGGEREGGGGWGVEYVHTCACVCACMHVNEAGLARNTL